MTKYALTLVGLLGALALTAVGCSSGDNGNGGGTPDAAVVVSPDANNTNPTPDAMVSSSNAIGQPCTPDQAGGQGDCPAGHVCLNLQGGSGAWCSKECTQGPDPVCTTDYAGPGTPYCLLTVSDGNGNSTSYCGVICEDDGANVCPNCPATCTSPLMCTGAVMDGSGNTVAKVCQ